MKPIVDRQLDKRSKLAFFFPLKSEGKSHIKIVLPFFENIRVTESKRARYAKYSPLARSSDLYTYLGANSRVLNLEFNITLPHIEDEHREIGISFDKILQQVIVDNPMAEQQKFYTQTTNQVSLDINKFNLAEKEEALYLASMGPGDIEQAISQIRRYLRGEELVYLNAFYEIGLDYAEYLKEISNIENSVTSAQKSGTITLEGGESEIAEKQHTTLQQSSGLKSKRRKAINLISYWVNIIRASVVNNSRNPVLGPPIIRFTNGILYQDLPCVCTEYSIRYDDIAGFDVATLLPRKIVVSMSLEEIRTGDFTEYNPGDPVKRDNLVGYEALISNSPYPMTLDPGRSYGYQ